MKNYKTKWVIFRLFLVAVVGLGFSLVGSINTTYAATASQNDAQNCIDTASFVDIAHITCTPKVGEPPVIFKDINPQDGDPPTCKIGEDCTYNLNYVPTDGFDTFCKVKTTSSSSLTGTLGYEFGASVRQAADKSGTRPLSIGDAGNKISLKFNIGYQDKITGTCPRYGDKDNGQNKELSGVATAGIKNILQFSNTDIKSFNDITQDKGVSSKDDSLLNRNYALNSYSDISSDGKSTIHAFTSGLTGGQCNVDVIIALSNSSGLIYTRYKLSPGNQNLSQYPDLLKFLNSSGISGCNVSSINFGYGNGTFGIIGTVPSALTASTPICTSQGCTGVAPVASTATGATGNTVCTTLSDCLKDKQNLNATACATNSNTTMEWVLCPIVNSISNFADVINGYVEDQLNFRVDSMLPNGGGINQAWSIVKNIVASLLVIIMLVMVISQAIGRGPFEAYTVKKILPRLVIAVIVMQFSWVLTKELINIANDLGTGIIQIMTAPFGGVSHLDLGSILHNLDGAWVSGVQVPILGIMLALILTPASTFILPIVLFIALAVGSALFVAMITLVFRNILLIMAVLFSPLALLLWILPGQTFQGYWKKYFDNFIKLLMLFPLVMGMIYAGRIVASLGGNIGKPGPIDYLVVMIAFFGPYFYLPKAFKWGGSILAGANQALNTNKALNAAKGWGYGRIKAETARRSGEIGKGYNEDDDYARVGRRQLASGKWWQKGGRLNPLALATTKAGKDEHGNRIRTGRSLYQLQGRKITGLVGGALLDKGLSREGMLKRGEQEKHAADEANKILETRRQEAGRAGEIPVTRKYYDKDGNLVRQSFPKNKGRRYSLQAGIAAKTKALTSGRWRAGEGSTERIYQDPSFAVYSGDVSTLDPENRELKVKNALMKKYGLKGRHDVKKPTAAYNQFRNQLQLTGDKVHALKNTENRTPQQEAELQTESAKLREMLALNDMYTTNFNGYSKEDRKYMAEQVAFLKKTDPDALREDKTGPMHHQRDSAGNIIGDAVYYVQHTRLPSLQKKESVSNEVKAAASGIDPMSNVDVRAKFSDKDVPLGQKGYGGKMRYVPGPNGEIDAGQFNRTDEVGYGAKEQLPANLAASTHERTWTEWGLEDKEAMENMEVGLQTVDNMGDVTLMRPLSRAKWFKDAFDLRDGQAAGVLAHIMRVPSTRQEFNGWMANLPTPADVPRLMAEAQRHPEKMPQLRASLDYMYTLRRAMGIADNDGRKLTDRDWRIMSDTIQRQTYEPSLTPEKMRWLYDVSQDIEGRQEPEILSTNTLQGNSPWTPTQPNTMNHFSEQDLLHLSDDELDTYAMANYRSGGGKAQAVQSAISGATHSQQPLAESALGRSISEQEARGLARAHLIGSGQAGRAAGTIASAGNYTNRQLGDKQRILRQAGFSKDEAKLLLQQGIAGDASANDEPLIQTQSTYADLLSQQSAAIQKAMTATDSSVRAEAQQQALALEAQIKPMQEVVSPVVDVGDIRSQVEIDSTETTAPVSSQAQVAPNATTPTIVTPAQVVVAPVAAPPTSFFNARQAAAPPVQQVVRERVISPQTNAPSSSVNQPSSGTLQEGQSVPLHSRAPGPLGSPQAAQEFGFNVQDAIYKTLKPIAEAAKQGKPIDASKAAAKARERIDDVVENMNNG